MSTHNICFHTKIRGYLPLICDTPTHRVYLVFINNVGFLKLDLTLSILCRNFSRQHHFEIFLDRFLKNPSFKIAMSGQAGVTRAGRWTLGIVRGLPFG